MLEYLLWVGVASTVVMWKKPCMLPWFFSAYSDNRPPPKCCFIEVSYPTIDAWRFTSANLPLVRVIGNWWACMGHVMHWVNFRIHLAVHYAIWSARMGSIMVEILVADNTPAYGLCVISNWNHYWLCQSALYHIMHCQVWSNCYRDNQKIAITIKCVLTT